MPNAPDVCQSCGARAASPTPGGRCEFCGALFRPAAGPVAVAPEFEPAPVRFGRLRAHASFDALLEKRPSSAGPMASNAFGLVFALVFVGAALLIAGAFSRVPDFGHSGVTAFKLFPFLFVGVGLYLVVRMLLRGARFASSEIEARPAIVVDERILVSGGGDSSTSTTYFVSLEDEAGQRAEYEASAKVAGKVAQGDIGVAYVRAERLLDFERVPA